MTWFGKLTGFAERSPEASVGIYERDPTQGPACAISCGAGTVHRNYFVPLVHQIGQSKDRQIDDSEDLGRLLGNKDKQLWAMTNGSLLPMNYGLAQITEQLQTATDEQRD